MGLIGHLALFLLGADVEQCRLVFKETEGVLLIYVVLCSIGQGESPEPIGDDCRDTLLGSLMVVPLL